MNQSVDVGTDCPSEPDQPLTVLVYQSVRRDKRHIFAQWCHDINILAQNFEGFISTEVIRPTNEASTDSNAITTITNQKEVDEYIAIVRFDNYSNLERWMTSSERTCMMERVDEFSDQVPVFSYNSIEHWFTSADSTITHGRSTSHRTGHPSNGPPPRYKMWLVTCVVIYGQVLWIPEFTGLILPVTEMDPNILKLINTVLTVTLSTFLFFPIVTRLLSFWLFPQRNYMEQLLELLPFRRTVSNLWSSLETIMSQRSNNHETLPLLPVQKSIVNIK